MKIYTLEDAPKGARLIVCGGRNYGRPPASYDYFANTAAHEAHSRRAAEQRARIFQTLDLLRPSEIAHGGALGVDRAAGEWAEENTIRCTVFPARWGSGYTPGLDRNRRMFSTFGPDGTVAFPGGTGTADMERVTLGGGAFLVRIDTGVNQ